MFTQKELDYLASHRLARFATVSLDGQPDVVPVGYQFDGANFYISGHNVSSTRKFKNVESGYRKVALVVDDLRSRDPWQPCGIRVYGTAEIIWRDGWLGEGHYLRITPKISWSWNIETVSDHPGKQGVHKNLAGKSDAGSP